MTDASPKRTLFGERGDVSNTKGVGYALLGLRLAIGWVFLTSGLFKLAENGLAYGYASKYLGEAVPVAAPEIGTSFPEVLSLTL